MANYFSTKNEVHWKIEGKILSDPVSPMLRLWLTPRTAVNGMFTAEGKTSAIFGKVFNEVNVIEFE